MKNSSVSSVYRVKIINDALIHGGTRTMLRITFRDIRKIDPVGTLARENFRKNALVGLEIGKIGSKQWEFHPEDERMG